MWKVLLVEDEAVVRRLLRQLIKWEEWGFEVVGEADNGEDALAMIRSCQPDLVIADIVMPSMDGIELLRTTREEGMDCCFVMLTCMNEFEYARQALEYGASGYILKLSMSLATLEETLQKINKQLSDRSNQRMQLQSHQFQKLYEAAWQSFQRSESKGKAIEEPKPLSLPPHVLICSVLHGSDPFKIDDFFATGIVVPDRHTFIHEFSIDGMTTIFYWSTVPIKVNQSTVHSGFRSGAVFDVTDRSEGYKEMWRSILLQLNGLWYSGETGLEPVRSDEAPASDPDYVPWEYERQIIQSFEHKQFGTCKELLMKAWKEMEMRLPPMSLVKETANRIDKICAKIAGRWTGLSNDGLPVTRTHYDLLQELLQRLEQYASYWLKDSEEVTDHREINKIIAYIKQNYDQDITLKSMAKYVAMDENYLSGLFKKKTGEPFIQYLQRVRIEQAKFYLEQTELPVNEIGERVGFASANYFFKVFKRWTNFTPSEFRTMINHKRA